MNGPVAWLALPSHTVRAIIQTHVLDLARHYYDQGYRSISVYCKDREDGRIYHWDYRQGFEIR